LADYGVDLEGKVVVTVSERGRPADILLIDDNLGDSLLIRIAFKKTRFETEITVADTAEAGLILLQMQTGEIRPRHPDIVLLDLNLPSMHGLTFLDLVKSNPLLSSIPVVVLSSSSAPRDVAASYRRHANGFVTKPNSLEGYLAFAGSISDYWFRWVQTPPGSSQSGDDRRPDSRGEMPRIVPPAAGG
jgi:CheY-like chemotaxis protein